MSNFSLKKAAHTTAWSQSLLVSDEQQRNRAYCDALAELGYKLTSWYDAEACPDDHVFLVPAPYPSWWRNPRPSQVVRSDSVLVFFKLSDRAVAPVRSSPGAAGYDLAAAVDSVVDAHDKAVVPTDLSIQLPAGTYGRVAPRSGLAIKHFIDVGAGVVDPDYRGNVGVVLFNHASVPFVVKRGDRIAQLVLEKFHVAPVVESRAALEGTERGAGGFGSTGTGTGTGAGAGAESIGTKSSSH